jgi:hypothetical protein
MNGRTKTTGVCWTEPRSDVIKDMKKIGLHAENAKRIK